MIKRMELNEEEMMQEVENIDKNSEEAPKSFNEQNCLTPNTKLIIVGTITPSEGCRNGYFYTARYNRIYGYIDQAIGTNLKEKKLALADGKNNADIVSEIIKILKDNKIAFLDVMKQVIRPQNSYEDDKIRCYLLDTDSFNNIDESVTIICNSKLAEEGYIKICNHLGRNSKHVFLSQRSGKKAEWLDTIKSCLKY